MRNSNLEDGMRNVGSGGNGASERVARSSLQVWADSSGVRSGLGAVAGERSEKCGASSLAGKDLRTSGGAESDSGVLGSAAVRLATGPKRDGANGDGGYRSLWAKIKAFLASINPKVIESENGRSLAEFSTARHEIMKAIAKQPRRVPKVP